MSDDPLDIDELNDVEAEPEPGKRKGERKKEGDEESGPGLVSRIGQRITAPFTQIAWDSFLTIRTGLIVLVAFLLVWLFLVNLAPVRLVLWFWTVDLPKALVFLVDVMLGALLMWLWFWMRVRAAKGAEEK